MSELGRILIVVGLLLIALGALLLITGRLNLPLGRLPGDFLYRGKNTMVYFPLMTSIVLSILISAVLVLLSRFKK